MEGGGGKGSWKYLIPLLALTMKVTQLKSPIYWMEKSVSGSGVLRSFLEKPTFKTYRKMRYQQRNFQTHFRVSRTH
jgi:hypothetical protein